MRKNVCYGGGCWGTGEDEEEEDVGGGDPDCDVLAPCVAPPDDAVLVLTLSQRPDGPFTSNVVDTVRPSMVLNVSVRGPTAVCW